MHEGRDLVFPLIRSEPRAGSLILAERVEFAHEQATTLHQCAGSLREDHAEILHVLQNEIAHDEVNTVVFHWPSPANVSQRESDTFKARPSSRSGDHPFRVVDGMDLLADCSKKGGVLPRPAAKLKNTPTVEVSELRPGDLCVQVAGEVPVRIVCSCPLVICVVNLHCRRFPAGLSSIAVITAHCDSLLRIGIPYRPGDLCNHLVPRLHVRRRISHKHDENHMATPGKDDDPHVVCRWRDPLVIGPR